jgi:hypothetical protein
VRPKEGGTMTDDPVVHALGLLSQIGAEVPPTVADLVERLRNVNTELWSLEDQARTVTEDGPRGVLKRTMDKLNLHRAQLVSGIDAELVGLVPTPQPDAVPLACSAGTILDRLVVGTLRVTALEAARDDRVGDARQQVHDLIAAAEADWADLGKGRRRLPNAGMLKCYAEPPSGP